MCRVYLRLVPLVSGKTSPRFYTTSRTSGKQKILCFGWVRVGWLHVWCIRWVDQENNCKNHCDTPDKIKLGGEIREIIQCPGKTRRWMSFLIETIYNISCDDIFIDLPVPDVFFY